jgi:hypothetical protein
MALFGVNKGSIKNTGRNKLAFYLPSVLLCSRKQIAKKNPDL